MSISSLTPTERSLRARLAAHEMHSRNDGFAITAAARAAGPGEIAYWLAKLDSDLPESERLRRAGHLKKAHYTRLALKSSIARRKRGAE